MRLRHELLQLVQQLQLVLQVALLRSQPLLQQRLQQRLRLCRGCPQLCGS